MTNAFRLDGLETDNLLGFLSLLGLLRALETARPTWFARAYFSGVPLRAWLIVGEDADKAEIARAAADGCSQYAQLLRFDHSDLTFNQAEARRLLRGSAEEPASAFVLSALFSDAAIREGDRIEPTPLCAMFGQGHQSFLARLTTVTHGTLPKNLVKIRKPPNLNDPARIERALFASWNRADETESFRWDHGDDRRYALRDVDPSTEKSTTEHGANRLAVLGLLSFQSAPQGGPSGRVNLATRGVSRGGARRRPRITWPIWERPATLRAIEALLDEPALSADEPSFDVLRRRGVLQARRVTRIMTGKFISFTRATALP